MRGWAVSVMSWTEINLGSLAEVCLYHTGHEYGISNKDWSWRQFIHILKNIAVHVVWRQICALLRHTDYELLVDDDGRSSSKLNLLFNVSIQHIGGTAHHENNKYNWPQHWTNGSSGSKVLRYNAGGWLAAHLNLNLNQLRSSLTVLTGLWFGSRWTPSPYNQAVGWRAQ